MGSIKLSAIEKWYNEAQVIKGIDLQIQAGAVSYTHLTLPTSVTV